MLKKKFKTVQVIVNGQDLLLLLFCLEKLYNKTIVDYYDMMWCRPELCLCQSILVHILSGRLHQIMSNASIVKNCIMTYAGVIYCFFLLILNDLCKYWGKQYWPNQNTPTVPVWSGSKLFVKKLLKIQQTTKADDFCCDWCFTTTQLGGQQKSSSWTRIRR